MDVAEMLVNLSSSYPNLWRLITSFAYVAGFLFIFRAMYHLKIYGELRTMMATQTGLKTPVMYIVVGAVFIYLPSAFDTMMQSTFGYTDVAPLLSYITVGSDAGQQILKAVLGMVQLVGLVAFVRGWILLSKAQEQGSHGGTGKGLTHIFGGLLAINIEGTWAMLAATLGLAT